MDNTNFRQTRKIGKNQGFTLIEILVVVSIIALIASVTMTSLNHTRRLARDAKRVADLNQVGKALEIYIVRHGLYPVFTSTNSTQNWNDMIAVLQSEGLLAGGVGVERRPGFFTRVFAAGLVQDPQYPSRSYQYMIERENSIYYTSGKLYRLRARLEEPNSKLLKNSPNRRF